MGNVGIDYGMGTANVDRKTGIRYGVISQHSIMGEALNDLEPYYGEPSCPKCGNVVGEYDADKDPNWEKNQIQYDGRDYICERCEYAFDSDEAFSDEAQGFTYEQDGYQLEQCLDSDIFVLASRFYTFAQFCSPCVPGAGNLDNAMDDGVKTYCLGHDWFEGGKAPYPVYSVETGEEVAPCQ